MLRNLPLALALTLASCTTGSNALVLPADLPGGFKLESTRTLPDSEAPAPAKLLGLRSASLAQYSGPAPLRITLYEMSTGAGAFELVQKWKPETGQLHFSQGPYFVLLESAIPVPQLQQIAAALEAFLKQESPHR